MLASVALPAAQVSPSVVDATVGRFNARFPNGVTATLLDELATDDDNFEELTTELDELFTDELLKLLLDELRETLLALRDEDVATLELLAEATVNFTQFTLIAWLNTKRNLCSPAVNASCEFTVARFAIRRLMQH